MSEAESAPLPFRLRRRPDGRYEVDLTQSRAGGIALLSRPPHLEPQLHKGGWLVLAFAAWSGPDRLAIPVALVVAAGHPGFDVGIRPYDSADEFATWAPGVSATAGPIWLGFVAGQLACVRIGSATPPQLLDFMAAVMDEPRVP